MISIVCIVPFLPYVVSASNNNNSNSDQIAFSANSEAFGLTYGDWTARWWILVICFLIDSFIMSILLSDNITIISYGPSTPSTSVTQGNLLS
jgi:hypothetical protein